MFITWRLAFWNQICLNVVMHRQIFWDKESLVDEVTLELYANIDYVKNSFYPIMYKDKLID